MVRKRIIITLLQKDPCKDIESLENLSLSILFSLIVSHGIRIDTILITGLENKTVVLYGEKLRHLYPQKNSLIGFIKAVYCREKQLPGTVTYYDIIDNVVRTILDENCGSTVLIGLVVGEKDDNSITISKVINLLSKINVECIVVNTIKKQLLPPRILEKIMLKIDLKRVPEAIAVIQYILDIVYGALLRRKGEVIHAENYL